MSTVSRRSVARGAAWVMPSITVAAASPAIAASPPPGLQGRVQWTEDCTNRVVTITPDDTGNGGDLYPKGGDYGFYVFNTKAAQVSGACMTFTFPSSLGKLTWKAAADNGKWSVPTVVSSGSSTYTYQTCYTGAFADYNYVDRVNNSTYYAGVTSWPSFTAPITSCPATLPIAITRTVVVSGRTLSFDRSITIVRQGFAAGTSSVGG